MTFSDNCSVHGMIATCSELSQGDSTTLPLRIGSASEITLGAGVTAKNTADFGTTASSAKATAGQQVTVKLTPDPARGQDDRLRHRNRRVRYWPSVPADRNPYTVWYDADTRNDTAAIHVN
ncbi:hypothetical protein [Streptacidiphilus anmyonensis]|uniref:hypothetical protein n=1 Tax=Streptacidiphilus anmyonensis TaxID=405782 RepID=UPI0005A94802|nr:hypothetical protein [Streptacidiphilus anmyonensis]